MGRRGIVRMWIREITLVAKCRIDQSVALWRWGYQLRVYCNDPGKDPWALVLTLDGISRNGTKHMLRAIWGGKFTNVLGKRYKNILEPEPIWCEESCVYQKWKIMKGRLRGIGHEFSSARVEVWIQWDIQDETKSSRHLTVVLESSWIWRIFRKQKLLESTEYLLRVQWVRAVLLDRNHVNFFNLNPFLLVISAQEMNELWDDQHMLAELISEISRLKKINDSMMKLWSPVWMRE